MSRVEDALCTPPRLSLEAEGVRPGEAGGWGGAGAGYSLSQGALGEEWSRGPERGVDRQAGWTDRVVDRQGGGQTGRVDRQSGGQTGRSTGRVVGRQGGGQREIG